MKGKKIILGVTGSIAAYKSAWLVRLFVQAGADVKVVITPSARDFITPLTLSVLSKNAVLSESIDRNSGTWNNHIELGRWADLFLVAPASANTIAKMATGICDNLLLEVFLSARCPVWIAPAMDVDMYHHPATVQNLETLRSRGANIIEPRTGELASGLTGEGRLEEPDRIFGLLGAYFNQVRPLKGKRALVTAGPTHENIDPVRFIGNRSTGKMGFAIAEELKRQGADVVLVTGPTTLVLQDSGIHRIDVESAEEMHKACMRHFKNAALTIMSAAVADYKPRVQTTQKIKKTEETLSVQLVKTKDILSEMGKQKTRRQFLAGFALETGDGLANAKDKLKRKNLDLIVLNTLQDPGAGFGHDTNKVRLIGPHGKPVSFRLKSKAEVARDIVDYIVHHLKK